MGLALSLAAITTNTARAADVTDEAPSASVSTASQEAGPVVRPALAANPTPTLAMQHGATFDRDAVRASVLAAAATASSPTAAPGVAQGPEAEPDSPRRWEGAVGLVLELGPTYSGASEVELKPRLAGFVRYGRFTITGAGGFTSRRHDEVDRGVDAELLNKDNVRVNLALRMDSGRDESDSPRLQGMGDIRPTVRARLGVRWKPVPGWRLGLSTSFDALNRVGGYVVEGSVAREWAVSPTSRLIAMASLSGAGDRYLQAWYGVTPTQAAATGYRVFRPREGLRDVGLGLTWRTEIGEWAGFAGVHASHLLGAAADSPLTQSVTGARVSVGIARRF